MLALAPPKLGPCWSVGGETLLHHRLCWGTTILDLAAVMLWGTWALQAGARLVAVSPVVPLQTAVMGVRGQDTVPPGCVLGHKGAGRLTQRCLRFQSSTVASRQGFGT